MRWLFLLSLFYAFSSCDSFKDELNGSWSSGDYEEIGADDFMDVVAMTTLEFKVSGDTVIISSLIRRYLSSDSYINGVSVQKGTFSIANDNTIHVSLDPSTLEVLPNELSPEITTIIAHYYNRYTSMTDCCIKNGILSVNINGENKLFRHIVID